MRRMPPLPQRRNAAYLNRPNCRFGTLARDLEGQALKPKPDLRLISGARSIGAAEPWTLALSTWIVVDLDCAA